MKNETYILKNDIYNHIDFPRGTIVKVNDWNWEFEVVKGKLKGEKGHIADGMNGHLLENNIKNKKMIKRFQDTEKKIQKDLRDLYGVMHSVPTVMR